MPFYIKPFFQKPFKIFRLDADTGKPLDPNVRRKITYYEVKSGSDGSKKLVAHKSLSNPAKEDEKEKAKPEDKSADNKPDAQKNDNSGAAAAQLKDKDVPFTAEEDEKLKTMKGEGKSWKEIAGEMGRAQHLLKNRWKEIGGNQGGGNEQGKKEGGGEKGGKQGQKGGDNNKQQGGGGKNKNKNDGKDKKDDKNANQKDSKTNAAPKSTVKADANNNDDTLFTMDQWLTVQEDDLFSFGELKCLGELIAKDSRQNYQRVAARFFDLTGRRVHPDDVRDKFESLGAMKEGAR